MFRLQKLWPCNGLVMENTNYNPSTPYAVSRAACDMSLMSFYRAYNFPVVFTRSANVYGPCQQLYRIIPITILNFLTGGKLKLHGGAFYKILYSHRRCGRRYIEGRAKQLLRIYSIFPLAGTSASVNWSS